MPDTHTAVLGIGSNLGDRRGNIERALELLAAEDGVVVTRVSSLIETLPVGGPPQGDFLNGAAVVTTTHSPGELLALLHRVEAAVGRVRATRNGPRTLDLDILFFDDLVIEDEGFEASVFEDKGVNGARLEIPHPRLLERAFVLEPLAEIAPDYVHPATGRTVGEHWEELRQSEEPPSP